MTQDLQKGRKVANPIFKTSGIHRTPISLAIALLIGQAAIAQQAPAAGEKQLDTVVVTGVRAALQRASEVKRDSDQVMDVITAEDVGKLPDANVAEALQRVTGVQVTRVWGEGQGVSIRGLPLVRVAQFRLGCGSFRAVWAPGGEQVAPGFAGRGWPERHRQLGYPRPLELARLYRCGKAAKRILHGRQNQWPWRELLRGRPVCG
ncbi:MAG: hypothetical protein EBT37_00970 [Betaproteobacteria bacterium]|nr:hypothetical protein [Betaproteobacteria bacterium]